ncbi:hypothetical protein [Pseudocolwellia sp. HL-MZ7]|uniref:hypothetical protein n=1 Tax=Pseudocolwellia sp. HL-MZ7 TaxID=3400627 RepID=UPI003CF40967
MMGQTVQAKSEFQKKLEQIVASQKAISNKTKENKGNSEADLRYCQKFEDGIVDENGYCKVFQLSEVTVPAETVVRFKPQYSKETFENITGYIIAEFTINGLGGVMDFNIIESVPAGAFDKKITEKSS